MRAFLVIISVATVLSVVGGHMLALWFGVRAPIVMSPLFVITLALIGVTSASALIGYVIWLAAWEREPNPRPRVVAMVRHCITPSFLARRLAPLVFTFLFLGAFTTFKVLIPRIQPFALDGFLSDLDRWVFGTDAWRLTHAAIGPAGTLFIDWCYGLWFPVWTIAVVYFSLFARQDMQRRFFLSFFAVWGVLGVGLATVLSSAGPCFLDLIGHPYAVRYSELFPLAGAPGANAAQHMLKMAYRSKSIGLAAGISAMPSVHVAVAALLVIVARYYGRVIFIAAFLFYAMIFLGSVHLGWHYVSDGLVGSLSALGIWHATRHKPRSVTASTPSAVLAAVPRP